MSRASAVHGDPGSALDEARRRSQEDRLGSTVTEVPPLDAPTAFRAARAAGLFAALWMRPDDGSAMLGIGSAASVETRGRDRILGLRGAWSELRHDGDGAGLRAFVGVSFDERTPPPRGPRWTDHPSALLVVPRLLVEWRDGGVLGRIAARAGDDAAEAEVARIWDALTRSERDTERDSGPGPGRVERVGELASRDRWRADVTEARDEIRRGALEKIVLARALRLRVGPDAVDAALSALGRRSPGCTVYGVSRGDSVLLGATPESLVRLSDGTARVSCVAGTAPRAKGGRDADTGVALLASAKDREEHAVVVRAAAGALAATCDAVTVSEPRLMGLATLWHLASEVSGRARPGVELLDLAAALHPTPAVCGAPREVAARVLAEREPFDRGWYGGALGWVDGQGEGELVVALRGALVRWSEAWLFAGCGIVAGSDPDAELAEADAKMRPMIEALGGR